MCDKYCDCYFCTHRDDTDFCGQFGDGTPYCHYFQCVLPDDCPKTDCISDEELYDAYGFDF